MRPAAGRSAPRTARAAETDTERSERTAPQTCAFGQAGDLVCKAGSATSPGDWPGPGFSGPTNVPDEPLIRQREGALLHTPEGDLAGPDAVRVTSRERGHHTPAGSALVKPRASRAARPAVPYPASDATGTPTACPCPAWSSPKCQPRSAGRSLVASLRRAGSGTALARRLVRAGVGHDRACHCGGDRIRRRGAHDHPGLRRHVTLCAPGRPARETRRHGRPAAVSRRTVKTREEQESMRNYSGLVIEHVVLLSNQVAVVVAKRVHFPTG